MQILIGVGIRKKGRKLEGLLREFLRAAFREVSTVKVERRG